MSRYGSLSHAIARPLALIDHAPEPMSCRQCGTTDTPLWRYGPEGCKSLCNACGIRWKRANKYRLSGGVRKRKPPMRAPVLLENRNSTFSHFLETIEGTPWSGWLAHSMLITVASDEYRESEAGESVLAPASPVLHSVPASDVEDDSEAIQSDAEEELNNGALFLHFISTPRMAGQTIPM
jgi:hypothetical protein